MKEKWRLPKDWKVLTLGDVCEARSSNVSQNKLDQEVGDYPIFGASGLIKNVSFYHQEEPYLSIVKDGSGFGRVTKMNGYTSVIGTLQYILPKKNVDLNYLYYNLISIDFKKYVSGAAIPHIYFRDYKNEHFLWMPLPEQQRIVASLNKAFAAIDKAEANTEQNLKNAKELFHSIMKESFEKQTEGWMEYTVQELVNNGLIFKPLDGNHGEIHPLKSDYLSIGIPFIMSRDMKCGTIDEQNCKFISEKQVRSLRTGFAVSGDVLLSHKGTIGSAAILHTKHDFVVLTPQITYYRVKDSSRLLNRFIYYQFLSPIFQRTINRIAESGSTRAYIGITKQLSLKLSFPSLSVQKTIVKKLDSLSDEIKRLESIYHDKIISLVELKKSILQKALSGELTRSEVYT